VKTVQAVPFMPGFSSFDLRISTLPAVGRRTDASLATREVAAAAQTNRAAARGIFIEFKELRYFHFTMAVERRGYATASDNLNGINGNHRTA
jgi:hypothetical protein